MEDREWKKIRNVYIFLDNTNYNKSHVLIAGLCSLVLLGICRKVKVGYLLVSHTHCDNDSEIGTAGTHLCTQNLPSFESFEKEVQAAFIGRHKTKVVRLVGITDYKAMFMDVDKNPNHINGISVLHAFRIVAREGASRSEAGVDVHYRQDFSGGESWFPRPSTTLPGVGNFNTLFRHPTNPDIHGKPIVCKNSYPVEEKRQRQQWVYDIGYSTGSSHTFTAPCPSLPYNLSRKSVKERLGKALRQDLKKDFLNKIDVVRRNILKTLTNRCDKDKHWSSHNNFLNSLPKRKEEAHSSYYNALSFLKTTYGGKVVVPPTPLQVPRAVQASDFICPISFTASPVPAKERIKVLSAMGLYEPFRKPRKNDAGATTTVAATNAKKTTKGNSVIYFLQLILFFTIFIPYYILCYPTSSTTVASGLMRRNKLTRTANSHAEKDDHSLSSESESDGDSEIDSESDGNSRTAAGDDDMCSDDDDGESMLWNYVVLSNFEKSKTPYADKLNEVFTDVDDPSNPEEYVIVNICKCDRDSRLFYEYVLTSSDKKSSKEVEHTPCKEIMESDIYVFGTNTSAGFDTNKDKKRKTPKGSYTYEERVEDAAEEQLPSKRRTRNSDVSYKL
jgi:hypothetical protein